MQIPAHLKNRISDQNQTSAGHLITTLKTYSASSSASVLDVVDVRKSFGRTTVLEHINLDLKAGEFVSFLGPSGCGKTTLLRIIAGLEHPDYGRIVKHGQDISQQTTAKRKCGIVFQNYALFPNLTVTENIAFGLHKKQWTREQTEQRVDELLALIELSHCKFKYPDQLSGGQQQRVALARAIAPRPDILLLDEPLSALDALVRISLRQKIRNIQQQLNLPAIMVTHDQEEALSISDRIAVMNAGIIEQMDTPHNIYYRPQTRFVAQFIGSMNFMQAQAETRSQLRVDQDVICHVAAKTFENGHQFEIAFRPENAQLMSMDTEASKDDLVFPVRLVSSEFLGAKRRVFCTGLLNQHDHKELIQVDIENHQAEQLSETMQIRVPVSALHIFDMQGRALC
ncbi:ABC transporter ATP-binding protein [Acinetobacter sp. WCHAc010052]|uniref:ABC transporter ATP-binding protein n=1 Tax=Acinetobacter sp. WCHAc010052 TaxID=2004647 RepID=UPI000B3CC4EB|nr:ATP-binding cassette domain-containing protein [Acinetobacter sp. WCHAc010052]AXY60149.1 ATP-binding cassette domain-containing protein [Acinetobacter sp. WCHAc010052]